MKFLEFFQKVLSRTVKWSKLGEGNYNKVLLTEAVFEIDGQTTKWVCKEPIIHSDEQYPLNDPVRACRKWHDINPTYPAYPSPNQHLWFMPYMGCMSASDESTAHAIIDIYQRTGNIVADGGLISNFKRVGADVVCVDVDLALRRNSISSELYFNEFLSSEKFDKFFMSLKAQKRPKTLICIKVLFFLEDCLSGQEFDHQLMSFELLNYCCFFASNGFAIDLTIYHNLFILSTHASDDLEPEYFHPLYLSRLPKCEDYKELRTHLKNIYENYDADDAGVEKKISAEDTVAELLGNIVNQVAKKEVFENHFFRNLTKRSVFANAAVDVSASLQNGASFH